MATYKQVQQWVKTNYGWLPKTCWIAHVKELNGFPLRAAPNRYGPERMVPCPSEKQHAIEAAFRFFGVLRHDIG